MGPFGVLPYVISGLAYGWLAYRRGSLWLSAGAHMGGEWFISMFFGSAAEKIQKLSLLTVSAGEINRDGAWGRRSESKPRGRAADLRTGPVVSLPEARPGLHRADLHRVYELVTWLVRTGQGRRGRAGRGRWSRWGCRCRRSLGLRSRWGCRE